MSTPMRYVEEFRDPAGARALLAAIARMKLELASRRVTLPV